MSLQTVGLFISISSADGSLSQLIDFDGTLVGDARSMLLVALSPFIAYHHATDKLSQD